MKICIKTAEITLQDFAVLLGVTPAAVTKYRDRGLPCKVNPKDPRQVLVKLQAGFKWVDQHLGRGEELEAARLRKMVAEADMAELEAAKMANSLVDAAEITRKWQAFLARLKNSVEGIPNRVAPQLVDGMVLAERIDVIDAEVCQTLRAVVAELEALGDQ